MICNFFFGLIISAEGPSALCIKGYIGNLRRFMERLRGYIKYLHIKFMELLCILRCFIYILYFQVRLTNGM